jgi:hypothetical protein
MLRLRHLADAIDQLSPAVRAMRPEAPWPAVEVLRRVHPFGDQLSSLPGLEHLLSEEIPALGKAAAEIIAELDTAHVDVPRPQIAPPALYQFKVTMTDITPPIWRRLLVSNTASLRRLHLAIQIAGGWGNCHLHVFDIAGTRYDPRDPFGELHFHSDAHARLNALPLSPGSRFQYLYDFGDGWKHEVLLEEVRTAGEAPAFPVCLAGERAFPPEDSGGVPGYYRMLRILGQPEHPEYKETRAWVGQQYDPEFFDLGLVNERLRVRRPRRTAQ